MKPYECYKETNIPWLKEIPSHWDFYRNKNVLVEQKAVVGENSIDYTLLSLTLNGVIQRDMKNAKGKFPKDFDTYKIVRNGNIIFCLFDIDETPRTVGLSSYDGMITGAYDIFEIKNINCKYLYYYYLSIDNAKAMKPLYTGLRKVIGVPTFLGAKLPVPTRQEQDQIVRFLDWKLSKIIKLIKAKKKQIALLNEQKQAIINKAVTKGLDDSVSMKDSGVEWIGEIPADWTITQVGKLFNIELGKMLQPIKRSKHDTLENYLCALNIFWDRIDTHNLKQMWFSDTEKSKYLLQQGDLIVVEGGDVATSCLWNNSIIPCYIQNAVHRVRPKSNVINQYLYYWLLMLKNMGYINQICSKATFAHFTKEKFMSLFYLSPPLDKQQAIVDYIGEKTAVIDKAILAIKKEFELVNEYKTSLVSSVVTGKVDVRNVDIPNFETEDEIVEDQSDEEIEEVEEIESEE